MPFNVLKFARDALRADMLRFCKALGALDVSQVS